MAQNKFLSFLNSLDKGASDINSITEFLANILTPGDNMEYVDGQLLGSGGKPVENIGDKTYYGTLGQANFAGNDPVKDGLLSKMTSAPPKLRPLGLLNKGERRPDSMGVGYKTNMRPDALDLPMTSAPDSVGSGRGDGAMEQQSREAQAAFNDYLNTLDPNMVDTAINNPEIMDIIRKMFFTANPGLIRGMGGYN